MTKEEQIVSATEESNDYIEENRVDDHKKTEESLSVEALSALVETLSLEKEKLYKQFLLSEADIQNIKRRAEIDVTNARKYALEKFVKELLPIIDATELEIAAVRNIESEDLQKFREGSELTHKMLLSAFEKFGIKQINPLGEKLNPELHQAITMQKNCDFEPNHIIQVVQNGYLLNDRLIRAAQVIVAE